VLRDRPRLYEETLQSGSGRAAPPGSARHPAPPRGTIDGTVMDHEAEYKATLRVPTYPEILARWRAESTVLRQLSRELDQPYGPGTRERYDLLRADVARAPLVVFIHGGYWQRGEREDHAFVARALNAAGIDVAVPSYSLCPAVSVMQIVDELRRCLIALWARTRQRPVVIGHSAGGHLTAAMLATDWRRYPDAPPDLVRAGCAISGVFELAPLLSTSLNRALQLDAASAVVASPLFWPAPIGRTLVAAVGSDETDELRRQSRAIAEAWGLAGVHTEYLSVADAHHFSIVEELARADSALCRRVVALARS
jgi:arylformamidase